MNEVQRLILDDINGKRMDVLHHLRTLPLDQAQFLLQAYSYAVDGDRGYGNWPDPMVDPKHWD